MAWALVRSCRRGDLNPNPGWRARCTPRRGGRRERVGAAARRSKALAEATAAGTRVRRRRRGLRIPIRRRQGQFNMSCKRRPRRSGRVRHPLEASVRVCGLIEPTSSGNLSSSTEERSGVPRRLAAPCICDFAGQAIRIWLAGLETPNSGSTMLLVSSPVPGGATATPRRSDLAAGPQRETATRETDSVEPVISLAG